MVNVLRLAKGVCIFGAVMTLYILYSPNLLDFEPLENQPCYMKSEGVLSPNKLLDRSQFIAKDLLPQPECLLYNDGKIYAALSDGRIVVLVNDKVVDTLIDLTVVNKKQSRPLGMRFFKGDLFIADGFLGLFKLDMKSGVLTNLLSITEPINGVKMGLPDDIDIDDQGIIYVSDFTTKWNLNNVMYGIFGGASDGRIIAFDTKTGKYRELLNNLQCPNGVQLTQDQKALLVTETTGRRVIKYHLQGPRKGLTDIFALLPGEPDNIRPSSRGGYWIVLPFSSNSTHPHTQHSWASSPKIRKIILRLSQMTATGLSYVKEFIPLHFLHDWEIKLKHGLHFLDLMNLEQPTVVEVDREGNIIRSLQSDNPQFSTLTHPLELEGHLYLGTFVHRYIVKVKL